MISGEQTWPRYVTLSRSEPQFKSFLNGTFSSEHVAVPTRTLNALTTNEEVTFEVIPSKDVVRPNLIFVTLKLFRPLTLTLSLGPALVSFIYLYFAGVPYFADLALTTLLGTILFHGSLNYLNDYFDHVNGEDRISPNGGSRAIQQGWVRAVTVKRVGILLLLIATALGIPALLMHPSLAILIAVMAFVAGLEFSSKHLGLKSRGVSEIVLFFLAGPLVSVGFSWAIAPLASPVNWGPIILIGGVFGVSTVYVYHAKNLEHIFIDAQSGIRTLAVAQGFDRAKRFLWVLTVAIIAAFASLGAKSIAIWIHVLLTCIVAGYVIRTTRRINSIASPLSSEVRLIRYSIISLHWIISFLMTAAALCLR